ncbi:MAG: SDR family oxidoreductase [Candidatus Omnitrophica bacterium]|nr:SDR family oxidoreductase [Candidatus Omnitrophota bacterium]
MKVLITGGGGYIGVVLTECLLNAGNHVSCLDRFFLGKDKIESFLKNPLYKTIQADVRTFDKSLLQGFDVVIDLAALSNDPLGQLVADKTYAINYEGRLRVCRLAKEMGVKRYILASSCSVYGLNESDCDETSKPNPISTYAKANLKSEEVLSLKQDDFCVTVLRFATVFGVSARMRFDLAVNLMTLKAFKEGVIDVLGQGMQWRPFVHLRDVAGTIEHVMKSDQNKVNGQIFNVGENRNNMKIINLAYLIREILPFEIQVRIIPDDPDKRSYKVNFDRIHSVLGLKMRYEIEDGVKEIYEALKKGSIWDYPDTFTVKWYKYLLDSEVILKDVILDNTLL